MVDQYDIAILEQLQKDGRLANNQLAEKIGLSTAPCWRRVKALEERGVITGYKAILDSKQLGYGIEVFSHVTLENHHAETVEEFNSMLQGSPLILNCYMTSGDADYTLHIVAKDMEQYQTFLSEKIMTLSCVRSVNSNFVLKKPKNENHIPIPTTF